MGELYELKPCVGWEDPDYELVRSIPLAVLVIQPLGQAKGQVWFALFRVSC